MKTCSSCQTKKPLTEFNKRTDAPDGMNYSCKQCSKRISQRSAENNPEKVKARRALVQKRRTEKYHAWKAERGCACCPERDPVCLDLHHLDPRQKDMAPSDLIRFKGWEAFLVEAAKCVVVCANCHRKIHAGTLALPL